MRHIGQPNLCRLSYDKHLTENTEDSGINESPGLNIKREGRQFVNCPLVLEYL